MTKTNTRSRIVSILLVLMMLLSLLPTTALAAGTYPAANVVSVDGGKTFTTGRLYFRNGEDDCSSNSTDYNAYYDPTTGTLTLKNYNGKGISVGGALHANITVKLVGTNTINGGVLESSVAGDIIITSDSKGTLSITHTLDGGNDAIGIKTGLTSGQTTGNVTIKGDAKVTINVTHNGTNGYDNAYGIYAKENITISEDASVDITCATPNNTTGGYNCNGLVASKKVIIDTNGEIKIDVTNAGGDDAYSYGIFPTNGATLTKVGNMEVKWKKHASVSWNSGGVITGSDSFSDTDHAINVDKYKCYASYRYGTPRTVTVENGTVTGPGVPNAKDSGKFLENDTVNIKPYEPKGKSGEKIPFKGWTSSDVTISSPTTAANSFTVPNKDVTVTAKHNPFDGTPTFTPTGDTGTTGTLTFKTVVRLGDGTECFYLVKDGEQNDESKYISFRTDNSHSTSPYEYSYETRTLPGVNQVDEGDYYVVEYLNGKYYLSEKFTVNYTAPVTTYTVSFNANGGTGTMANVTGVTGSYTLPACTFTAPSDKQFKGWATSASGAVITGTSITVSADTTLYAIWEPIPATTYSLTTQVNGGHGTISASKTGLTAGSTETITFTPDAGYEIDTVTVNGTATSVSGNTLNVTMNENKTVVVTYKAIEYNITVTDGKATIGAGSEISKAAQGTTVTLTANAAPDGKVFDKWEVVSGGITLADANSASTTFTMPAEAVSVKATYKNKPVTTYSLTTQVNGGHGTISASKTGLAAGSTETVIFTPDAGYEIDTVTVNGVETGVLSNVLDVTMDADKTVIVAYKAIEYNITVTDGKATIGAGSGISKAAQGTTVTLTANAAPDGKVFDKWEVVSGGITLADANSATTTFTMPASAVSVKAIYKDAPHTHTFDQETVKDEALKSAADCTNDAVYYKSCACGEISTTETFTAADTALGHDWATDWSKDADNHWKECSRCHEKKDNAAHDYGEDNICDTCGHDKTVPHTHNLTLVPAKAPTCTEKGNTAYYTCDGCDKWFEDATGASEITDKTSVILAATGHSASDWKSDNTDHWKECTVVGCGVIIEGSKAAHTAGEWIIDTPATATTSGTKHKECTVCGYTMATETIPATGGGEHTHSYGSDWKNDATNHWHECACGDKADTAAHSFQWVIDKAATKEATGIKHEECTVCGAKRSENTVIDKLPDGGNTGNTGSGDNNTNKPGKDESTKSPQTGDSSNLIGWLAALFVSGGVLTVLGLNGKKRKESEAE